jgi:uncharacterized membrane protein YGL010W
MKTIHEWLDEYQDSHLNPANKLIHWICVPVIAFTVCGFLRALPGGNDVVNAATIMGALAFTYYAALSWRLALGMAPAFAAMYAAAQWSYHGLGVAAHLWVMAGVFFVAWVGQFIGHHIEGTRPSFFKDLQFLLIGPLWLMAHVYRKLDLPIDAPSAARAG